LKFLIDAQLPKSLALLIEQRGHITKHTLDLPESNATTDQQLIDLSVAEKWIIITKDSDFLRSYLIRGKPEKLIMVRTGNISNNQLLLLFESHLRTITTMLERSNLIEINSNEIAEHGGE